MVSAIRHWLILAVLITALCGLVYLTAQQIYRQSANDPQIQMAEDLASDLSSGKKIEEVLPKKEVDISKSLSPFIIIFDSQKRPIASTAVLDGKIPLIPSGVFDYVAEHGEDRFTWQPKSGVRSATVVRKFAGSQSGYVLAGRSLREVEKREERLSQHVGLALISTLFATLLIKIFLR